MANTSRTIEKLSSAAVAPGLISVVVPVMNGAGTLQRCIDSFTQQTYPRKELIVVDGGSTDGTVDLIRANASSITRWVSEPDRGIYDAYNKGVRLSSGEWLLFLGSDDVLWKDDVLERLAESCAAAWPPHRVVYGRVAVLDSAGSVLEVRGQPWSVYRTTPIQRWTFEHQGILQHRSLFEVHGLFDESFRLCGDQELLLRELMSSDAAFVEEVIVAGFRLGGASSQPRNLRRMIQEKRRSLAINGLAEGPVVSQMTWVKMVGFEIIKAIIGLRLAERLISRFRAV